MISLLSRVLTGTTHKNEQTPSVETVKAVDSTVDSAAVEADNDLQVRGSHLASVPDQVYLPEQNCEAVIRWELPPTGRSLYEEPQYAELPVVVSGLMGIGFAGKAAVGARIRSASGALDSAIPAPKQGTQMTLQWSVGNRIAQASVTASHTSPTPDTMRWALTVSSVPVLVQRRRFVRELIRVPSEVRVLGDRKVVSGVTVDVSEGGVSVFSEGAGLPERLAVNVIMDLPDRRSLQIPGTTLAKGERSSDLVVGFEPGHEFSDDLRALVFAAQRQRQAVRADID